MAKKAKPFTAAHRELIHPDKIAQLRALAKERVEEELRKAAEDAALDAFEAEYRQELNEDPDEEERTILIDLPGHSTHVRLDSRTFYHGSSYTVKRSVFDMLQTVVAGAWAHEDEIGGTNRDRYVKPSNNGRPLFEISGTKGVTSRNPIGARF